MAVLIPVKTDIKNKENLQVNNEKKSKPIKM